MKRSIFLTAAAIGLTACMSTPSYAKGASADADAAFEQFKKLAGTFIEVEGDGAPAQIEYQLISRGAALTETWIMPSGQYGPEGKTELTVFHMDNGQLVATHYCASGIHPTMVLDASSPSGTYNFVPRTISNLASSDQSHNSGFGYTFEGEDIVHRSEQWTVSGAASVSHLRMVRSSNQD